MNNIVFCYECLYCFDDPFGYSYCYKKDLIVNSLCDYCSQGKKEGDENDS